jgi:hypothetical protein
MWASDEVVAPRANPAVKRAIVMRDEQYDFFLSGGDYTPADPAQALRNDPRRS